MSRKRAAFAARPTVEWGFAPENPGKNVPGTVDPAPGRSFGSAMFAAALLQYGYSVKTYFWIVKRKGG
jgi:hypothetical protein